MGQLVYTMASVRAYLVAKKSGRSGPIAPPSFTIPPSVTASSLTPYRRPFCAQSVQLADSGLKAATIERRRVIR